METTGHISPLTGARFFAALLVFLYHQPWMEKAESPTARWVYSTLLSDGYMGVSFFFILSGFILTYTYQERFRSSDPKNIKNFYIARFARIYPLHAITLLASLPIVIYASKGFASSLTAGIFNVSLLQSFLPIRWIYFSFNAPSWSISDETFFYALFPLLLISTVRNLKIWIGAAIAIFLVLLIAAIQTPNTELSHWFFYIFPMTRLWDFLLGILLARVAIKFRARVQSTIIPNVGAWAALVILAVCTAFHNDVPQNIRWSLYYAPAFALLIFSLAFNQGAIARLFSHPLLVYLGKISFGFYMIHQLVLLYSAAIGIFDFNPYVYLAFAFVATLIASMLSHKYFEEPMNKWVKQRMSPRPVSVSTGAAD